MASTTTKDDTQAQFLGTKLQDLPTPSAVLDVAKVEVNCQRMLDAVRRLDLGWRPHIKTHKVGHRSENIGNLKLTIDRP